MIPGIETLQMDLQAQREAVSRTEFCLTDWGPVTCENHPITLLPAHLSDRPERRVAGGSASLDLSVAVAVTAWAGAVLFGGPGCVGDRPGWSP